MDLGTPTYDENPMKVGVAFMCPHRLSICVLSFREVSNHIVLGFLFSFFGKICQSSELERWLGNYKHWLFYQRTQVQFPVLRDRLQLPITPISSDLIPLHRHTYLYFVYVLKHKLCSPGYSLPSDLAVPVSGLQACTSILFVLTLEINQIL